MSSAQRPTPTLVQLQDSEGASIQEEEVPTTTSTFSPGGGGHHDQTHNDQHHQHDEDEGYVSMSSDTPQHDTEDETLLGTANDDDARGTQNAEAIGGEHKTVEDVLVGGGEAHGT